MKSIKKLLGERIREFRKLKGFTQERLAELVGVERRHISRIEGGYHSPSLERLEKISEALEVPVMDLFNFMYLNTPEKRLNEIETLIKDMSEEQQQLIYKIAQVITSE